MEGGWSWMCHTELILSHRLVSCLTCLRAHVLKMLVQVIFKAVLWKTSAELLFCSDTRKGRANKEKDCITPFRNWTTLLESSRCSYSPQMSMRTNTLEASSSPVPSFKSPALLLPQRWIYSVSVYQLGLTFPGVR